MITHKLVRKHIRRLVEAKITVKSHTRTSKKGHPFTVKQYEREIKSGDVVKFGNRIGVVTTLHGKDHAYVMHNGGSTLVHIGNLKKVSKSKLPKHKELRGFVYANKLVRGVKDPYKLSSSEYERPYGKMPKGFPASHRKPRKSQAKKKIGPYLKPGEHFVTKKSPV